jgi:hypothetical protein
LVFAVALAVTLVPALDAVVAPKVSDDGFVPSGCH